MSELVDELARERVAEANLGGLGLFEAGGGGHFGTFSLRAAPAAPAAATLAA